MNVARRGGGGGDGGGGGGLESVAMVLPVSYWQHSASPAAVPSDLGSPWGRRCERGALRGAGERRHTCSVCGKAFKLKHHLVEHYVVHREEKPFSCPVCAASFKRAKQVKYHMKLHHRTHLASSGLPPISPPPHLPQAPADAPGPTSHSQ
ncbi:Vascular endothelial zinc finger 1 [Portunus trituberculatus]|uniref:Vascular endothelial zinc finger 1 n=1 Tax=Portunus trituberculatus TaxID=210409 RepID=A0A5B7DDX2_PORTR|nr:Vascular endothelial zinc finger 1 [Portunus trituberculatus]